MLMPHKVTLEKYAGASPVGDVYADPVTVRASVEDVNELVTNSDGQEVVSSTRVFIDPENWVPAGSRVTVWVGAPQERTAKVITAATFQNAFLGNVELRLE
jgi:hypothetical protein